jgi:hypothetical protein
LITAPLSGGDGGGDLGKIEEADQPVEGKRPAR